MLLRHKMTGVFVKKISEHLRLPNTYYVINRHCYVCCNIHIYSAHARVYVCVCVCVYTTPPPKTGCSTRTIFKRSTSGWIEDFPSPKPVAVQNLKCLVCPTITPSWEGGWDLCLSWQHYCKMKLKQLSLGFELGLPRLFPTTKTVAPCTPHFSVCEYMCGVCKCFIYARLLSFRVSKKDWLISSLISMWKVDLGYSVTEPGKYN